MITRQRACAARKRTSSLCRRRRATSRQRAALRARHRACSTRAASSPLRWRRGGGAGALAGAGCPHVNQDGSQLSGRRVAAAATAGGWLGGAAVSAKSCRLEPRASGGSGGGGGGSFAAPGRIALGRAGGWSASSGRAKSRPPPRPASAAGCGAAMRSLWPGGSIIEFLSARVRLAGIGARRMAGADGCTSTAGLRPWRPPCSSEVGLILASSSGRFELTSPVGLRLAAAMPASSCTLTPPPG